MRGLIFLFVGLCVVGGYSINGLGKTALGLETQSPGTQPNIASKQIPKAYRLHAVERRKDGHFYIDATVEGRSVRFLVDTGASSVLLSQADAQKLGHMPPQKAYTYKFHTASGVTYAAKTTLDQLRIGRKDFANVEAFIIPEGLNVSLLGQSVLARFESVQMQKESLKLTW